MTYMQQRRAERKQRRLLDKSEIMQYRRPGESLFRYYWRASKRDIFLIAMVLPGLANFIIWCYGPMYGIIIAFKDYNMKLGILGSPWADDFGLSHIISFLNYPYLGRLIWNTVWLNLLMMIIVPLPGILFALFLNELKLMFFKRTVQTISYFPYFLSTVAVVGMFTLMLSPSSGMINSVIKFFGFDPIYFMMDPRWFRTIMVVMAIWQSVGWDSIVWLARIATIDQTLYEAAAIDGASRWQRMWRITLPAFKEWYVIGLIMSFGSLLASGGFEKIYLMYNPSIAPVADTIGMYMFQRGLQFADYSYGAAIGLVNSLICLVMIFIGNAVARRVANTGLFG